MPKWEVRNNWSNGGFGENTQRIGEFDTRKEAYACLKEQLVPEPCVHWRVIDFDYHLIQCEKIIIHTLDSLCEDKDFGYSVDLDDTSFECFQMKRI